MEKPECRRPQPADDGHCFYQHHRLADLWHRAKPLAGNYLQQHHLRTEFAADIFQTYF